MSFSQDHSAPRSHNHVWCLQLLKIISYVFILKDLLFTLLPDTNSYCSFGIVFSYSSAAYLYYAQHRNNYHCSEN